MSLRGHLALVWLSLLAALGLAIAGVGHYASQLYFQEINQRLNESLAMYVVERLPLIESGAVNTDAFQGLAEQAMVVNPSVEVYLLDAEGAVLAHALPQGTVARGQVTLAPVREFLAQPRTGLLLGTDPRQADGDKAFSAAAIEGEEGVQGYLYVILGGSQFDVIREELFSSFIARVTGATLVVLLLMGGLVGLGLIRRVSRPLEKLDYAVSQYTSSSFVDTTALSQVPDGTRELVKLRSEFEKLTLQLAEQLEQIQTTGDLRRELLANVSHDLRTPLSLMQGYLETLLIKDANLSTEERRQHLSVAHKHTRRMSRLVADLFELSKLEAGVVQPAIELFSMSELLQDVIQQFQLQASKSGVALNWGGDVPKDDIQAAGDIALIERVLVNLIQNALRYTSEGGQVEVSLHVRNDRVQVKVKDSGCGISESRLSTIFDRYDGDPQAEASSGLGLAIVRRILELHETDIEVTSQVDRGSCFTFVLPTHTDEKIAA